MNFLLLEKIFGKIIGTSLKSNIDYKTADWKRPCVILMGNEQSGLSDKLGDACDQLITIPMRGRSDSLNLAVATGISLYEFCGMKLIRIAVNKKLKSGFYSRRPYHLAYSACPIALV